MPEPPDALVQALAERYVIERELGHGGSATVYLARDLKYGRRQVALKVLSREVALAVRTERFRLEIEFAAQLNHPNILTLIEAGSAGEYLFYTMPPVEEGSLRGRLDRERRLPVQTALAIAGQVADALEYAHARGVIHRDIKPGNILMRGDHVWVADFGIARAIEPSEALTDTGPAPGTVAYMSPEHSSGRRDLDQRTDVYSLGCVLFEMLTGSPPFTGPTRESVLAQQAADPPPSLRGRRPDVPTGVERIVERALAKRPGDRFQSATEFRAALARGEPGRRPRRPTLPRAVLASAVVVLGGWIQEPASEARPRAPRAAGLDTLRYLVLPFEYQGGIVVPINEDQLLHDALAAWDDIAVVDRFQTRDTLTRYGTSPPTSREAQDVAVRLRAGRYVRGEVSRIADSLRVHASLYDANANGSSVSEATVKLAGDLSSAGAGFAEIAERLLFRDDGRMLRLGGDPSTRSYAARREYARGLAAVEQWELAVADSAFVAATEYDPDFPQAHLWVAQVRFWDGATPATWRSSAERATAGRARLATREQMLSDALLAFGRGDVEGACAMWQRLTQRQPSHFPGWHGLATCLSRDDIVVRSLRSPSGWQFRSSYYRATRAYERAFQLLPSVHRALSARSYASVRRLLHTDASSWRAGRALAPDTTRFAAFPSWLGDTLAFVAYPRQGSAGPAVVPRDLALAVHHQRELFRDIAMAWATARPQSMEAIEASAVSRELLEDPTAIATIREARSLAKTGAQRFRLAGAEVWMRVKFGVPGDLEGLRSARALADSLLRSGSGADAEQPLLLASLAALTGRAQLAAAVSRSPIAADQWGVPPQLARTALPLLIYAAFGGPRDSLSDLEHQVDSVIEQRFLAHLRQDARIQWLVRPARLAFPSYQFSSLPKLIQSGDFLIGAEAAFVRGDSDAVRRVFARVRADRQAAPLSAVNLEGLYPEAHLLAGLGDPQAAIAWLDGTLGVLSGSDPQAFLNPANAGALGRAMALRAELADKVGDRTAARRWARMVTVLWSDGDAFLKPVVRRMQGLVNGEI